MNLYTHLYYRFFRYYRGKRGLYSGWPQGYSCILISLMSWMLLMGTISLIAPHFLNSLMIYLSAGFIAVANFVFFYRQRRYEKIESHFDEMHPVDHVRAGFVTIAFIVCTVCFYLFSVTSGGQSS